MSDAKHELVRLWLLKAQRDLAAAQKIAGGEDAYLDVAIYLCQQPAEKALKGFLVFYDQRGFLIIIAIKQTPIHNGGWI